MTGRGTATNAIRVLLLGYLCLKIALDETSIVDIKMFELAWVFC
jgi:hypothetical protein